MSEIRDKIKAHIHSEYADRNDIEIADDTQLLSSGIIDSISALQLVDFIEKEFSIEFEAHEVDQENINTIECIEAFIISKKA